MVRIALCVFVLAACGDDAQPSVVVRGPVALEDFQHEHAATLCRVMSRCERFRLNPISLYGLLAADVPLCTAYWSEPRDGDAFNDELDAARRGLLHFDPDAARTCLDRLESECQLGLKSDCEDDIFDGLVPLGGPCSDDRACAGDALCAASDACGVCTARPSLGEACTTACSTRTGPTACDEGVCVRQGEVEVGVGAACNGSGNPQPRCASGLFCRETETGNVCTAQVPAGGKCDFNYGACAAGSYCVGDTCVAAIFETEVGAVCDPGHHCHPWARLACVEGRCASFGDGGAGTPCDSGDSSLYPASCRAGFHCRDSLCVASEPECTADAECAALQCLGGYCTTFGPMFCGE